MSKWKERNKPHREHEIRSGTILRIAEPDGQPPIEILIGEVNEMGGACDCCRWLGHDSVVLAELDLNEAIEAAKKAAE